MRHGPAANYPFALLQRLDRVAGFIDCLARQVGADLADGKRKRSILRYRQRYLAEVTDVGLCGPVEVEVARVRQKLRQSSQMPNREHFSRKVDDSQRGQIAVLQVSELASKLRIEGAKYQQVMRVSA